MESTLPPLLQATSGAVGSAVGNAIVYPLDLATTRMQNAAKRSNAQRLSLLQTLQRLIYHHGLSRLYKGLRADTLSTLLSNFLYFFTYTSLQKFLHIYRSRPISGSPAGGGGGGGGGGGHNTSPAGIGGMYGKASDILPRTAKVGAGEELIIGMLAGIISKGITLPISTVCVRQQVASENDNENGTEGLSLIDSLRSIFAESGIAGLFSGLIPTIPLTLLPSLTLYIHSVLLRVLVPEKNRAHPSGRLTFVLAALSNALATIPLYPLVLLKTLSQSGSGSSSYSVKGKEKEDSFARRKDQDEEGMAETFFRILNKNGVAGLYTGLEGQIVKGLVQQGVMMLIKQRVEEAVVRIYRARSRRIAP
ncbi:hypothetical protein CI109_101568 [Kwoniella shandongensis]|uniref:Uncharacterized protein n=1 Tax=Kwoniella shandongensis TaxID=1734106 RepID=A0A5M6C5S9_9TREE|nr:uncharacterized protein CI109_001300 [Kwoniella shandongensis]KAA5530496.1 hypothetical protein CI109_001300 [Kwoniella shandongensis]